MPELRLTTTSLAVLRRLCLQGACIVFNSAKGTFFYHHGRTISAPVRDDTVAMLARNGLISRQSGSPVPIYRITARGQRLAA